MTTQKYLSGFCSVGQCEGTKPVGWNGTPLKTCWLIETCSCECHAKLDQMFEMTGQPRILVDVSGYKAPERTWWMPSDDPDFTMDAAPEISTEGVAVIEKPVHVTPTGRTSRGGLESWVQRECLNWLLDKDPEYGMPVRILSEEIGRVEGITPPSQGAIAAVFDRWVKYDYAIISTDRPRRFLGLTELGAEKGLDWCRANYKAQSRKKAS